MSIGSDIRDELSQLEDASRQPPAIFSSDAIPFVLATVDAFVILLSSLAGGIGYQWLAGYPVPSIMPHCAVGLLASFIHILRMNRSGYYDFPESAKPRVEVAEVLICWTTTGLLLAFLAFLLKIGVDYSRGAFVVFYVTAPIGLLAVRKVTKGALAAAVSRGAIGRRDAVLMGEFNELAALGPQDLLILFGAAEVNRFTLSREDDSSRRAAADARIIDSVADFVRRHDCREILLALSWGDDGRLEFIRDRVKTLPVAVRLLPDVR
ncbi:MAG: undecaprenyl-phosphate glucose phosphotransferase, partial [Bradyrhizobium sp.]